MIYDSINCALFFPVFIHNTKQTFIQVPQMTKGTFEGQTVLQGKRKWWNGIKRDVPQDE